MTSRSSSHMTEISFFDYNIGTKKDIFKPLILIVLGKIGISQTKGKFLNGFKLTVTLSQYNGKVKETLNLLSVFFNKFYQDMFQNLPEFEAVGWMKVQLSIESTDGVNLWRTQTHSVLNKVFTGTFQNWL